MKMRKKPVMPTRKVLHHYIQFDDGETFEHVINRVTAMTNLPLSEVKVVVEEDYDYSYIRLKIPYLESEESFADSLQRYHDNLIKYHQWYDANKAAVEEYLDKKKTAEKEKKSKIKARHKENIEREMERLRKQLERLEKEKAKHGK